MADRDLCANCRHWREEHYDTTGAFQGKLFGCDEYQGIDPDEDRAAKKEKEVRASRIKIAELREKNATAFYGLK